MGSITTGHYEVMRLRLVNWLWSHFSSQRQDILLFIKPCVPGLGFCSPKLLYQGGVVQVTCGQAMAPHSLHPVRTGCVRGGGPVLSPVIQGATQGHNLASHLPMHMTVCARNTSLADPHCFCKTPFFPHCMYLSSFNCLCPLSCCC